MLTCRPPDAVGPIGVGRHDLPQPLDRFVRRLRLRLRSLGHWSIPQAGPIGRRPGVDRNPDAAPTVRPEDQSGCPMCHDPTDLFGVTQPPGPSAGGEGTARSFLDPQDLDEAIFLFGLAIHLQTAVVLE